MDTIFTPVAESLSAAITWWANNPLTLGLLGVVIVAVAAILTALDRRTDNELVHDDDVLLDRLGSATPGQPTSDLDTWALTWRDQVETTPIPDLLDTDTAITVIRGL